MPAGLFAGIPIPLVASAARTTSGNSGNLKDTSLQIPVCDAAAIILDVTALTGNLSATIDVFIDTSPDNGTTWYPAYHFAQVTTSTKQQRIDVRDTGIGMTEAGASVADLTASTVFAGNTVMTRDTRIRWVAGGTFTSTTFAVWGIFQPSGSRNS